MKQGDGKMTRLFRACDCYSVYCRHNPDPKAPFGADYRIYAGPGWGGLFIGRSGRFGPGDLFIAKRSNDGGYELKWPKKLREYQERLK